MPDDAVAITVNGRDLEARPGELVIDAAERGGVYIPRFCYHPRMRPVGMCRMCIVEIDTGRGPALLPSCMIPVAPDMKVDTQSPTTKKAQDGVLEFLLINHPLDCPVCDKGGECPLQDQTLAYGPGESRFIEEKRHFEKPIPISDTVYLDRERCILCDRCTRFAKEVAGDPLISFMDRGGQTQVNTFPDHPFASYFSGNTVQICPVGALTAKPYRFRARPWDLAQTESTCTSCAVGCRVVIDSSRNRVLRYNGVDIDPVNWGWLCDKGRFDFEAVHHKRRLGSPMLRPETGDELAEAGWGAALSAAAAAISHGLSQSGPGGVAVLGGARLTNEDAYAWAKLAKSVIGTDHVDAQLGDGLPADLVLGLPRATIDEALAPGATVVLLGPDLKEELPVLHLRLRHAIENDAVQVVELSSRATSATELAAVSLRHQPGQAIALIRAVLGDGPVPPGAGDRSALERAGELVGGGGVTVLLGRASLADAADPTIAAAAYLADRIGGVRFLPVLRRANVHGALDMGLAPGVLPGRVSLDEGRSWYSRAEAWGSVPAETGLDATGILTAAAEGRIDTLILLGADPLVDFPDRRLASRGIAGARTVIACDQFLTASAAQADVVLPAAGYAECGGTTTNLEGRISTLGQIVTPPGTARSDWTIAAELAFRLDADLGLESVEEVWAEIERLAPSHAGISVELLRSPSAADGVVAPLTPGDVLAGGTPLGVEGGVLDGSPTSITGESTAGSEAAPEEHAEAATASAAGTRADDADSAAHAAEAARRVSSQPSPGAASDPAAATDRTKASGSEGSRRPPQLRFRAPSAASLADVPPMDSYSLRLVVSRRLYDDGTLVQHSPSLAGLARPAALGMNPGDLSHLGLAPGAPVKLISPAGSMGVEVAADPNVPRGVASVTFNQEGLDIGALIDVTAPVTDVRVETP